VIDKLKAWWTDKAVPWMRERPATTAVVATAAVLGGLFYVGGHIIVTGVVSGAMMALGVGVILYKVKHSENRIVQRAYEQIVSRPLLSDVAITGMAFILAPAGLTAWVAATVTGLLASCWLLCENARITAEHVVDLAEAEPVGVTVA
jgi:hypothetical protein